MPSGRGITGPTDGTRGKGRAPRSAWEASPFGGGVILGPMTPRSAWLLLVLFALAPAGGAAGVEPSRDLRPGWEAGETATYELWLKRRRVHRFEGQPPPGAPAKRAVTYQVTGTIGWRVDAVGDFGARCRMVIERIRAAITTPDGTTHEVPGGDGSHPATKQMGETLSALRGATIDVELAPDGTVAEIGGYESVIEASGGQLEKQGFVEMASRVAAVPSAPAEAAPGASWTHTITGRRAMGSLEQAVSYRLAGVREIAGIPVATIDTRAELSFDVNRARMPQRGPKIDIAMTDGARTGRILLDLQRGEVVGRHAEETRRLEMRVHMPQRTITQIIETTSRRQLLRIAETDADD